MNRMKGLPVLMLMIGTMLAPLGHAQPPRYTVKIENASGFNINKIFMSRVTSDEWGPDLLADDVLNPGFVFTGHKPYGLYDLRLVDEDGDVCVVNRVPIHGSTTWKITDTWLLNCEFR